MFFSMFDERVVKDKISLGCDILKVEVLLSCMNQTDYSILDKTNISTDAVVVNQCDIDNVVEFDYKGSKVIWCNSTQRGISRSRNLALQYASHDICLLVDDDEILVEGYERIITNSFETVKQADLIFFNLHPSNPKQKWYVNTEQKELSFYNIMRYGAPRAAFRREKIVGKIQFNESFGPGTKFYSGEDSLFFVDVLKKGLKAYTSPEYLANIEDGDSTWFTGYTEQYFITKGAVFTQMSKKYSLPLILQYILRYSKHTTNIGFFKAYSAMLEGRRAVMQGKI